MSETLKELRAAVAAAHRRDGLIVQAREAGHTWREIAAAAELTELATRQAATRANGGVLPQPDR